MRELGSDLYRQALLTGAFGELRVGAARSDVVEWLDAEVGPAWARRMEGHAFYDMHLQIWFQRSVTVSFGLYFRGERAPSVELDWLTLGRSTPRDELLWWLKEQRVEPRQGRISHLFELPHAQLVFDESDTFDSVFFARAV